MQTTRFLSLENLNFSYRAKPVLRDINFTIEQGQQWAVLGANGSGKTSLAKIICKQLDHISGNYWQCDTLTQRGTAYVCFEAQKSLWERDKKLDMSEFSANAQDAGTTVQQLLEPVGDTTQRNYWIEQLGLTALQHRGLRFISTGEMRKTLLAQGILARPVLLVLDNPLDGLDKHSQQTMRSAIDELLQSEQAVLLLCRQSEDIPQNISHVLVLDGGRVVASGERDAVLADAEVQALLNPPVTPFGELPQAAARPYQLAPDQTLVEMHDVSVSYGNTQVLNHVNWCVKPGEHWQISGPNGCGKSTLLSLITGDNHKAYGQNISLFGRRRGSGESVWDIRQKFGQLDNALHINWPSGTGVLDTVISGFFDTSGLYDNWTDAQKSIAVAWLCALGLNDYQQRRFDELSFGIQRLVLLARAMVKSPAVLVLDEATLGLDGHHRRLLLTAVDHIADNADTHIMFISHTQGEAPVCINRWLEFVAGDDGFAVTTHA